MKDEIIELIPDDDAKNKEFVKAIKKDDSVESVMSNYIKLYGFKITEPWQFVLDKEVQRLIVEDEALAEKPL